jgi:aminoglycoside phosphotransferase (APT) family kinase protein
VLDWEEAAYGDPAIDVAYAIMNLYLRGLPDAADAFLNNYEAFRGQKLENLAFWQLVESVRPMVDPVDWNLAQDNHQERLLDFIESARQLV